VSRNLRPKYLHLTEHSFSNDVLTFPDSPKGFDPLPLTLEKIHKRFLRNFSRAVKDTDKPLSNRLDRKR
jgi:hypothetical protein